MTSHGILERLLAISKAQNFATLQDVDPEGLDGVTSNEKAQNRAVHDASASVQARLELSLSYATATNLRCQTCRSRAPP